MNKLFFLVLVLLSSCTSSPKKNTHKCELAPNETQDRHVIIAAKLKMSSLAKCFKNYLQFEKNKKQSLNICHNMNVAKNGKVTYTKAYGIGKPIPNDFKMCIEQELWMMNFSKLQLEKPSFINFSFKYNSI